MRHTIVAAGLGCLAALVVAGCGSRPNPCPPAGDLNFICGLDAPEDLVLIPDSRWMITSGMTPGSGLHLVDTEAKRSQPLSATGGGGVAQQFSSCPGPLDPAKSVLHGLSLRPSEQRQFTLYATNHGERESIEVFRIDARGATPLATWIGCVPLPDQLAANSVAAFGDGTLVATVLMLPNTTFEDVFTGRDTGVVLMWEPGSGGFRTLAGTELSGNNGIETSADDSEFFVASSGSKRIVAYSRTDPSKPLRSAQLEGYAPDNLRLVNGQLLTAGMLDDEPACGGAPKTVEGIMCARGYVVSSIDPKTMAVTEVARGPAAPPYKGTATGLRLGNELWLSSFNSDRLAYRTLAR